MCNELGSPYQYLLAESVGTEDEVEEIISS
jgi:hypothetical protein